MKTIRPALAIALLVSVQSLCVIPGLYDRPPTPTKPPPPTREEPPTAVPEDTEVPVTEAPAGESVGTINLVNSQVETGPPENLQSLQGAQDFYNGNGVRVTQGGKGKLDLNDGSQMTLFNETQVSGVTVYTSPPETDFYLQNQGFLGTVPPGRDTTVHLPNGAAVTILGTTFFVIYDEQSQVATAGNFDGSVLYVPPGGTDRPLGPGQMVSITAQGAAVLMGLPFSPDQFEAAVDAAGTPTAGLAVLMNDFQIVPFPVVEIIRTTFASGASSVAFSPDGSLWIAGGCEEGIDGCARGSAYVMDAFNGKAISSMIHSDIVYAVAFSPDGRTVASGSGDGVIVVWDALTGEEMARMAHGQSILALAFSPDGSLLLSGSDDDTARVWEAFSGIEVARLQHDEVGAVVSVDFSPDGNYLVTGSFDGTARVWDTFKGVELARITHGSSPPGHVRAVALSPDGNYVVSGGCDSEDFFCYEGTARVWQAFTGEEIARLTDTGSITSVAFSPDGRSVASGIGRRLSDNIPSGALVVWDAFTGAEIVHLELDHWISLVAFSPDGRYVASASENGLIEVWDAFNGGQVVQMTHDGPVHSLAFSPDGRYIASASGDGTARVWLLQTN